MAEEKHLPDNLSFSSFDDEDDVLDFINGLDESPRKLMLSQLSNSEGQDLTLYCRPLGDPEVHMLLLKFANEKDGGLVLLLSRNESNIYSYFERLKEETPGHSRFIDDKVNKVYELMKMYNSKTQNVKK